MKIKYQDIALRTKAVALIGQANAIINEYAAQGYSLTLRQLYYQFVARGLLANLQKNYKMLGEVISSGRRAGLIDWDAIVDRTRFLRRPPYWDSPADLLAACANQFKVNLWADQEAYVEVWFEKDALLGVFDRACAARRLPMISCRGYGSDSTWWESAQRIQSICGDRVHAFKPAIILHFGDHDPSGLDMTRDIEARLNLFGVYPTIKRMALTMAQVKRYNPPPNPAKETDSRFADYQAEFGNESWELDALSPDVLVRMVEKEVSKHIDEDRWNAALALEETGKSQLLTISQNFNKAVKAAKGRK